MSRRTLPGLRGRAHQQASGSGHRSDSGKNISGAHGCGGARANSAGRQIVPELPDIVVYIQALQDRIGGKSLRGIRLNSPFLLRTVSPALNVVDGRQVTRLE